jgi:hypothetical protein
MWNRGRNRWRGLVLALAFASGSPSLSGAFRCCMADDHGPQPVASVTAAAANHVHAAAAMEGHAHHGVQTTPSLPSASRDVIASDHESGSSQAPCTCVGPCNGALIGFLPALATCSPVAPVLAVVSRVQPAQVSWVADSRGSFVLPFANGPPRA